MRNVRQIDVTKSKQRVGEFLRQLGRIKQPIEILLNGETVGWMVPPEAAQSYVDFTPEERECAWKDIEKIQRKVGKALKEQGITEEDVIREVLKDD